MDRREKDDVVAPEPRERIRPVLGPDTREPTWSDYVRAVQIGGRQIASGFGAAVRRYGEEFDNSEAKASGRALQDNAAKGNEADAAAMSPSARARLEAAITDDEFTGHVFSSIGLKLTTTAPAVLAAVVPAALFSSAWAAGAVVVGAEALINTSQFQDNIYQQTDGMSDEQLQKESPAYAKLRETKNQTQAREEYTSMVTGIMPFYVAAASLIAGSFGNAAQLTRFIKGGTASAVGHGGIKGVAAATGEGALSEMAQDAPANYGLEKAKVEGGVSPVVDGNAVVISTLESGLLGGIMGAGAGAVTAGRGHPKENPAMLPSAEPKPNEKDIHKSTTAAASTDPAIRIEPVSPNSNPKVQAVPAAPSVVTGATVAVAPRKRPPRAAAVLEPAAAPVVVPGATSASTGPVQMGDPGLDAAVAMALAKPAQAAPVQAPQQAPGPETIAPSQAPQQAPVARTRPVLTPRQQAPEAAVQAAPIQAAPIDAQVTSQSNPQGGLQDNNASPAPTGELGSVQTAAQPSGPVSSADARTPRILPDVRPEIVEQNRDDAFQQRERMLENQRAIRREELGPAGRTDLYGKAGEKRRTDATAAKSLFESKVPETDVIPTKASEKAALKARLDGIMESAKEAGIEIPTRIDYAGTSPTDNHLVWLREVADLQKAFGKEKGAPQEHIQRFLLRERAAKAGDFDIMKSERKAEGDQAKRGAQASVETIADPRSVTKAIDSQGDTNTAPVASAASAELDAVPTVASANRRGSVRDDRSENKPGSEVRSVSDEVKAATMARLQKAMDDKARIAGGVVDDAKFTKDVAKEIAAPTKVEQAKAVAATKAKAAAEAAEEAEANAPTEKLPAKVTAPSTPKVESIKKKVAAAAKKTDRNPSQARIDAGNYEKGKVNIQGVTVSIETPRGATRKGVDSKGNPWEVKMPAHYGSIARTTGVDGEQVDVTIGPNPASDFVLVIDQMDARTGKFDEHKTFIGYPNVREALGDYVDSFSDGKGAQRLGEFTPMTMAEFKQWLKGDTTKAKGDLAIAEEARVDALITPRVDEANAPAVELSDSEVRGTGPIIPNSSGARSITSYSAADALNKFVNPTSFGGLNRVMYRFIKARLLAALGKSDVKVHFVTDKVFQQLNPKAKRSSPAFYQESEGRVVIRQSALGEGDQRVAHVVTHELTHAATVRILNDEEIIHNGKAVENKNTLTYHLTALLEDVKRQVLERGENMQGLWGEVTPDQIYGFKNIREFLAEGMSEPALQDILAKLNVSSDVATFLKLGQHQKVTFWSALVDEVRRALGMPTGSYTALEAIISLAERATYASRMLDTADAYEAEVAKLRPPKITSNDLIARSRVDKMVRAAVEAQKAAREATPDNLINSFETNLKDFIEKKSLATQRSLGDPKWLRMRSLTDMATLAKSYFRGNSVRRVVNAIEAIRVTGGEYARKAEPVLNDLINAQRNYAGTKGFEQMASVMHDATMSGVHPDRPLDQNPQLGKKSMKGFWGRAQHEALAARYNALPQELKDVYQKSMGYFQEQHNAMIRQSLENRILKALGIEDAGLADRIFNSTTTDADKVTLGDMYEDVAEPTEFKKATGPYFPLKRFGDYVVRGTYKQDMPTNAHRQIDANTFEFTSQKEAEAFVASSKLSTSLSSVYVDEQTGSTYFLDENGKEVRVLSQDTDAVRRFRVRVQNRHVEFFEDRAAAEDRRTELEGEGVQMESVVVRRDDPRHAQGDMLSTHMERLMTKVEGRDGFKAMSETQQNETRRAIEQASYSVLSSTRLQTTRIQRKYVEGASKDIIRSTAEYASSMAGYLARYKHQGELDVALKEMNKEADAGGEPRTAMGRSMIRNEIMYRMNQPNIAAGQSVMGRAKHRLLVTSFIGHLASPAYSLINATQPIMVTVPIVSARHGLGATVAAMARAYSDISAVKSAGRGIANTVRRARDSQANTNTYVGDMLERISDPNERAMLGHLVKHGAIDADSGMEISKLVDTTRGDQWLSYFEGISRQLPLAVESINRFTTALASYRLEMKRTGDHELSTLYAQEMVESTQGLYANTNAPPIFSSPIASIAFQFKKYGHMIYSLLGQQIGKAIRNENVGDRAEAMKALGYIAAAHVVMAGTVGLPTEPIKMLLMGANLIGLSAFTMDDFEEWERDKAQQLFGSTAAEMITHGITRGVGVDLSSRMGMQSFLTFGEPQSSKDGDIWAFIGETAAGAPGGMLMDMAKGAEDITNGDMLKGMSKMVPVKIIKDGIKAYQGATEGKLSKSGRQTMTPMSMPEAAMKVFGLTSGRAAETQAAQSSYYRNTGRLKQERSKWMDRWANAKPSDRGALWKKVQEWNKDQPPEVKLSFSTLGKYATRRKEEDSNGTIMGGMRVTAKDKAIYERTQRLYND